MDARRLQAAHASERWGAHCTQGVMIHDTRATPLRNVLAATAR